MAAQALAETDQPGASVESSELYDDEVVRLSITVLRAGPTDRQKALDQLIARGNPDVVPTLILLLRYGRANEQYADAIRGWPACPATSPIGSPGTGIWESKARCMGGNANRASPSAYLGASTMIIWRPSSLGSNSTLAISSTSAFTF
jgi:hypothetical protein